jgi:cytochrome P450
VVDGGDLSEEAITNMAFLLLGGGLDITANMVGLGMLALLQNPEQIPASTDPETLDLARPATGHIAFGHGIHQCIGQQLARVEMRVAFPALFRRFPSLALAVSPEEVPLRTDMVIYGVHELPVTWATGPQPGRAT